MIYFYIFNCRIEFRKVRAPGTYTKKFFFLRYWNPKLSSLCKSCKQVRPKYKHCHLGIPQHNKKICTYREN